MNDTKRLWIILGAVIFSTLFVLGWFGHELYRNTYDPENGVLTISKERASAIAKTADPYIALFGDDPALAGLRESYALHEAALPEMSRRKAITAFFFWTAWASTTERPGKYALTVIALFVVQALLGGLTAHYTVEGDKFQGTKHKYHYK